MGDKLPEKAKDPLKVLAKKVQQPEEVVCGAIIAFILLVVLMICPPTFLFDVVGAVYPMFASLKLLARLEDAVDNARGVTQDAQMWITYWCIFTILRSFSGFTDIFLSVLPFGFYIQLAGLVYLYFPSTNGAKLVYEKVVKPHVFPILGVAASPTNEKAK